MKFLMIAGFLVVLGLSLTVSHIYLYRRLVRDTTKAEGARRLGRRVFWFMPILLIVALPSIRILEFPGERILGFICFGWGGLAAISVAILLCLDAFRFVVGRIWSTDEVDPNRRRLISQWMAGTAALTAGATGASGVALAMSDPLLREMDVPIDNLPVGLAGLRIVQLSDIHFGPTLRREFADHLVERVNALKPDLVAITGDLVDGSVDDLGPAVQRLMAIESRHGTFFVTGNHEYYSGAPQWVEALSKWGFKVLRNECITIEHDGAQLDVLGVDDWRAKRFAKGHGYDFDRANSGRQKSRTAILLSHQPKAIADAAKGGIDLVLAGHTHGVKSGLADIWLNYSSPTSAGSIATVRGRGYTFTRVRGTGVRPSAWVCPLKSRSSPFEAKLDSMV